MSLLLLFLASFLRCVSPSKSNPHNPACCRILDRIEEYSTGCADAIAVNSSFTATVFRDNFPSLASLKPAVLYPPIHTQKLEKALDNVDMACLPKKLGGHDFFLSINRYERKKDIGLCVEAFARLLKKSQASGSTDCQSLKLCIAGGYDPELPENKEVLSELTAVCKENDMLDRVVFRKSISFEEKVCLLSRCIAILYTPCNEVNLNCHRLPHYAADTIPRRLNFKRIMLTFSILLCSILVLCLWKQCSPASQS